MSLLPGVETGKRQVREEPGGLSSAGNLFRLEFPKAGERQTQLPPVSLDSDSSIPAPRLARCGP